MIYNSSDFFVISLSVMIGKYLLFNSFWLTDFILTLTM
jgi:hypothetical protein